MEGAVFIESRAFEGRCERPWFHGARHPVGDGPQGPIETLDRLEWSSVHRRCEYRSTRSGSIWPFPSVQSEGNIACSRGWRVIRRRATAVAEVWLLLSHDATATERTSRCNAPRRLRLGRRSLLLFRFAVCSSEIVGSHRFESVSFLVELTFDSQSPGPASISARWPCQSALSRRRSA